MKSLLILSTLLVFAAAQLSSEGCYIDQSDLRLVNKVDPDGMPITPDSCVFLCGQDGWAYAGVQGPECYCAGRLGESRKATESECNTPCDGSEPDAIQRDICGGPNRISVHRTGVPPLADSLDDAHEILNEFSDNGVDPSTNPGGQIINSPPFDPFQTGVNKPSGDPFSSGSSNPPMVVPPTIPSTIPSIPTTPDTPNTPNTPPTTPNTPPTTPNTPPTTPNTPPTIPHTPHTPHTPHIPHHQAIKCPICPYKRSECGGPSRGECDRTTGVCKCKEGWSGGACAGHNGKPGAPGYRPPGSAVKCPICPYKAAECGGPSRGDCNKATGECVCKEPWSGGACSSRNGKPGAPGYRRPPPPHAPPPTHDVLCPICPYKKQECGGPSRGVCNRNTGACECKDGWSGGACAGHNGKPGAPGYRVPGANGALKCPICPYKREECGGAHRGTCNTKSGECECKDPYYGGACSNRPGHIGAPGYNLHKPDEIKCPICAFKNLECGGPTHGDCNRQTGDCKCKTGYGGGACSNHGDKVGDHPKSSGNHKCPICPYKKEECGGANRGSCDRSTGNCVCKDPFFGGACSNRPGHRGAPGYNLPPSSRAYGADSATYSESGSGHGLWASAVAVLSAVVVALFIVVIILVVKLTAKEEERV